ncbi:MAG: aa3-type cytochrome c oxidase subunit IV [Roseomonas sp.]|nr:aa3-type cytochrome c oxidase subunit IV [Roseomonas sp.]
MAEQQMNVEMVEVKSEDIMAERRALFDGFMVATKWTTIATIALLVGIYVFFG